MAIINKLKDIANTIRIGTGKTDTMKMAEMPDEIFNAMANTTASTDNTEAYEKAMPASVAGKVNTIYGKSVVWNQLFDINEFSTRWKLPIENNRIKINMTTGSGGAYLSLVLKGSLVDGHKYYARIILNESYDSANVEHYAYANSTRLGTGEKFIFTWTSTNAQALWVRLNAETTFTDLTINEICCDLTLMFGAGNEPSITEFEKIISNDYYEYNSGEIKSFPITDVVVQGKNLFNISNLQSTTSPLISVEDDKIIIENNTSSVGFANTGIQFKNLCPNLKVGDTIRFSALTTSTTIELKFYVGRLIRTTMSYTITQNDLDAQLVLYGGYNEKTIISNFQIEIGTSATSYSPYKSPQTISVPYWFGDGIGDVRDSNSADSIVSKFVRKQITSKYQIGYYSYEENHSAMIDGILENNSMREIGLCNRCSKIGKYYNKNDEYMWFGVNNQTIYWIGILDTLNIYSEDKTNAQMINEFKTWLDNNYTEILCLRENPFTYNYNDYDYVDLGTLKWVASSMVNTYYTTSLSSLIKKSTKNLKCTKYSKIGAVDKGINTDSNGTFYVKDSDYTDVDTFKSAMQGVYLIYERANPITDNAKPFPIMSTEQNGRLTFKHMEQTINMCDEEWESGYYNVKTGNPVSSTGYMRFKNPISVMPNTSYYLYCGTNTNGFGVIFYDINDKYLGYVLPEINTSFTTIDGAYLMRFYPYQSYGNTYKNDIGIYKNEYSEYVPYGKTEYTHMPVKSDIAYIVRNS